jgi:hypothetical protein
MRALTQRPRASAHVYLSRHRRADRCRVSFFKFGKNGADASEAFEQLERDDFDRIEMEHYFNYTGRLAVEKTYDSFYEYLKRGVHPVDVILLWASEESDLPKVEEVLNAGANPTVQDLNGKTPLELATDEEVKGLLQQFLSKETQATR